MNEWVLGLCVAAVVLMAAIMWQQRQDRAALRRYRRVMMRLAYVVMRMPPAEDLRRAAAQMESDWEHDELLRWAGDLEKLRRVVRVQGVDGGVKIWIPKKMEAKKND